MGAAEAFGGSIHDGREGPVRVGIEFVVPNAEDRPSFAFQKIVTRPITRRFRMMAPIQLNDQLSATTGEIRVIRADRQLACELRA